MNLDGLNVPDYMLLALCPHLQHYYFRLVADISFLILQNDKKNELLLNMLLDIHKNLFFIPELNGFKDCCEKKKCKCHSRAYFNKKYPWLKYKVSI
jgi:hypothetical protein